VNHEPGAGRVYGLMAEFETAGGVVSAAKEARRKGFRQMDAFSPFPLEELIHAVGHDRSRLPFLVLLGGIFGAAVGYGLQYWVSVLAYPLNVAGRPLHSWPLFIPVTFEMTILVAAVTAVLGMLAINGLPQPYHPVFNAPRFAEHASTDRFFLCIEATDPLFDLEETRAFLESLGPTEVVDVED
jgi:hypothetical protein